MMEGMNGFGWGMGAFGWVFMVLFWGLTIIGIAIIIKWLIGIPCGDNNTQPQKSALQILQERYARGEINREEFEEKKRNLEN